ncbi:MAG: glycosyltransferase family 4 protein [Chloroflexi bacterium]|nr:glycosyltransferase family 4 protein [Chloroflexota bacterium]MCL5074760.1 glycosyltransferase family 4 protein [Chloroflexota bacterium]
MHIGIDASRARRRQRTGTETYSLRLIQELLRLGRHRYTLYFDRPPASGLFPPRQNLQIRVIPFPRLWTHLRLSWEMIAHSPDLLFVPAHVIPLYHPKRTVVTLHDLGYLYYREAHPFLNWCYLHLSTYYSARVATSVIVDSEVTKEDLIKWYRIEPQKISVVYLAPAEAFRPVTDVTLLENIKSRYGIRGDYLLYVGTLQPRKNVAGLLEAFAILKREMRLEHTLVIAGKPGWSAETVWQKVKDLDLEARVCFTGYVADDDLPSLFSAATLFVLPSLYEGFGLPAVEAMACGTPVVASNASSLPEVIGEAGILIDPHDPLALAEAMARVVNDAALRAELKQHGLERAKFFSWQRCAEETLQVLEGAG